MTDQVIGGDAHETRHGSTTTTPDMCGISAESDDRAVATSDGQPPDVLTRDDMGPIPLMFTAAVEGMPEFDIDGAHDLAA